MSEEHHDKDDPLGNPKDLIPAEVPEGVDRRKFIVRSAVISAAAVMNGCTRSETERTAPPPAAASPQAVPTSGTAAGPEVPLAADLNVVQKGSGPVLTTVDEFDKVGPGPASSHTIGHSRIAYA